jgi:hypothetical protein
VRGKRYESTAGPATLGTTAKADLLLRTWCNACRRHVDVDPANKQRAMVPIFPSEIGPLASSARNAAVARSISLSPRERKTGASRLVNLAPTTASATTTGDTSGPPYLMSYTDF